MLKIHTRFEFALAAIALTAFAVPANAGPTAVEILKKTQALMEGAKTYQAVMLVNSDAGKAGRMTMRLDLKTSGKKSSFSTTSVGQPTGQFAMAGAMGGSQIVDDGQNMWIYSPAMKTYAKRPSTGGKNRNMASPFNDIAGMTKESNLVLAGTESIAGKPAYVIKVNPKNPARSNQTITFYIDQASYHMKQMKVNSSAPSMASKTPQPIEVLVKVQSEKFNEPIPDSAFRFSPPAGAKEMQGGMFGGAGNRPAGRP
jgi:outer membrane lipoprotein-sorting protein